MAPKLQHKSFFLLLLTIAILFSTRLSAQVSITTVGVVYAEDFNTLAISGTSSTLPAGWVLSESGANANTTYTAGTGSSNAGDTYSFGATGNSERAFGGLRSGNLIPTIGVNFINNTGALISTLAIAYRGEQWRLGAVNRVDRLDFQYSTDATSLTTGTWADVNTLDFTAPNTGPTTGALSGNSSLNSIFISALITGLSIADGSSFWLRWNDLDATGADDGLAVDSFRLKACDNLCGALPLSWLSFRSTRYADFMSQLKWTTTEEINNAYFEVQRSVDEGYSFLTIERIEAAIQPGTVNSYEYVDHKPSLGKNMYRIMQVDYDGQSSYSPINTLSFSSKKLFVKTWPNPAKDELHVQIISAAGPGKITLLDVTGRVVLSEKFEGSDDIMSLVLSNSKPGIYSLVVDDGTDRYIEKIVVIE